MTENCKGTLKTIGAKVMYILETVVPNITFTIIFLTFMLTIVSRYILRTPISWSYEVSILAYMWTMFFGVGRAMERGEHVVFSLVYDKMSLKGQLVFTILSDVLLISLLAIAFVPSVLSLLSKRMMTGVLKMPYTIVFAPFIYMFAEIIIRATINVVKQVKVYATLTKEGRP